MYTVSDSRKGFYSVLLLYDTRDSTDDLTGLLYFALEKDFTIEFAHFSHDGERRFVYRWGD